MLKVFFTTAIVAILSSTFTAALTAQQYESQITFYTYNGASTFNSTFNTTLTAQGCDPNGKFAIIVHGWLEGIQTPWVPYAIKNLLKYRGGCVIFMDYFPFSKNPDYGYLRWYDFDGISAVLMKKVKQIAQVASLDQLYMFGFSIGARLAQDVGTKIGNQSINRMELCEPAAPGFDITIDPRPAAKNVDCIDTSQGYGTWYYNCHRNFIMGRCGGSQDAAGPYPLGHHGLCPYFWTLAFTNDYVSNNVFGCYSARLAKNLTSDVKMGYRANFNRTLVQGDIFIATAQFPPYIIGPDNAPYNQVPSMLYVLDKQTCSP